MHRNTAVFPDWPWPDRAGGRAWLAGPLRLLERALRRPASALGLAAAIAGLAFMFVSARVLPLLAGITTTLAIGWIGPWIAVAGVTARIVWDRRRCRVGETLTATLSRRAILPWWQPQIAVRWPDEEHGAGREECATAVGDGWPGEIAIVPRRRGRFPRSSPLIESHEPFGVAAARRRIAMPAPVIVWPASATVRVPAGPWRRRTAGWSRGPARTEEIAPADGARRRPARPIHPPPLRRSPWHPVRQRASAPRPAAATMAGASAG